MTSSQLNHKSAEILPFVTTIDLKIQGTSLSSASIPIHMSFPISKGIYAVDSIVPLCTARYKYLISTSVEHLQGLKLFSHLAGVS